MASPMAWRRPRRSVRPSAITVNSFSKYFSMTGWRVGWLVLPEDLSVAVERLGQNLFLNTPTVSQYAALAAFDCREELEENVRRYARNREILMSALPAMGIGDFAAPDGAFYVYADIGHLTNDSMAFCRRLLDETGVAITPGVDFDRERGSRTVRLSYCAATGEVEEAMDPPRLVPAPERVGGPEPFVVAFGRGQVRLGPARRGREFMAGRGNRDAAW